MEISTGHIKVTKTARFYTLGELTPETRYVWFLCHGYGQLAYYFLQHFIKELGRSDTFVVAPEGLSRFYLSEDYSRVGASWMTKEDRTLEIDDQQTYLTETARQLIFDHPAYRPDIKKIALGFSQGTATIWRWLDRSAPPFDYLILWAGMAPAEMDKLKAHAALQVMLAFGNDDPFITPDKITQVRETIDALPGKTSLYTYPGGHSIHEATLSEINAKIRGEKS